MRLLHCRVCQRQVLQIVFAALGVFVFRFSIGNNAVRFFTVVHIKRYDSLVATTPMVFILAVAPFLLEFVLSIAQLCRIVEVPFSRRTSYCISFATLLVKKIGIHILLLSKFAFETLLLYNFCNKSVNQLIAFLVAHLCNFLHTILKFNYIGIGNKFRKILRQQLNFLEVLVTFGQILHTSVVIYISILIFKLCKVNFAQFHARQCLLVVVVYADFRRFPVVFDCVCFLACPHFHFGQSIVNLVAILLVLLVLEHLVQQLVNVLVVAIARALRHIDFGVEFHLVDFVSLRCCLIIFVCFAQIIVLFAKLGQNICVSELVGTFLCLFDSYFQFFSSIFAIVLLQIVVGTNSGIITFSFLVNLLVAVNLVKSFLCLLKFLVLAKSTDEVHCNFRLNL